MSEITYIKCDGTGCENMVVAYPTPGSTDEEVRKAWGKDDLDADLCPACQEEAAKLEEEKVDPEALAAFGAAVSTEADKAEAEAKRLGLEKKEEPAGVPLVGPAIPQEEFDAALEAVVKDLRKQLKKDKKPKEFIEETVRILREQAAGMRKQKEA